jgi:cytochrome b involved in lipid metabolism
MINSIPIHRFISPLDWAKLKQTNDNLSVCKPPAPAPSSNSSERQGVSALGKYSLSDIKAHNQESNIWVALHGRVYNLTSYMSYHPGGRKMLMGVAGKDATALFCKCVNYWLLRQC